jgi:hypothetical protein
MKNIILISLFSSSLFAANSGNDLYLYGVSYHTNRDYHFKELNLGIGYGKYWEESDNKNIEMTVQVSTYENSYSHFCGIATAGPRFFIGHKKHYYAFVAVNAGFTYSVDYTNLIIIPTAGFGYKNYNINVVYIPNPPTSNKNSSAAVGMFLGYKF